MITAGASTARTTHSSVDGTTPAGPVPSASPPPCSPRADTPSSACFLASAAAAMRRLRRSNNRREQTPRGPVCQTQEADQFTPPRGGDENRNE